MCLLLHYLNIYTRKKLESVKSEWLLYTKNTLPRVVIFSFSNFLSTRWKEFYFYLIWKIRNSPLFHLSENHQCWVNLWNIGMQRNVLYTSEQALIIWLYLRHELSIVSILFFSYIVYNTIYFRFLLNL